MSTLIILGSSRKDGDTGKIARILQEKADWDLIDLNAYEISYYDYEHQNASDDYLPLMREIVTNYDTIVFATPVYWYSMSGVMKVFFDRLSDLLTIEKELGKSLKGKQMAAISCSGGNHLGEQFWLPFSETANYLEMSFIRGVHLEVEDGKISDSVIQLITNFIDVVNAATLTDKS